MKGPAVGNDVVDLRDPGTLDKHTDARFLGRVLGAVERAGVEAAAYPHAELWALWAAKEAAFKVVSKLRGKPPVFAHAAFAVEWTDVKPVRWVGSVTYEQVRIPVVVERHDSFLHAVAAVGAEVTAPILGAESLAGPPGGWGEELEALLPRFTAREADAVHSLPSAAVRLRARTALAAALSVEESALEIVCDPGVTGRRPPRVLLNGLPAPADVSLSHHGGWIAWAILLQNPPGR